MTRPAVIFPLALVFMAAGLFMTGLVLLASPDALVVQAARFISVPLALVAMPVVLIGAPTARAATTRGLLVLALLCFCVAVTFLREPYPDGLLADLRNGRDIHPVGAVLALIVFLPFVVVLGKGLGVVAAGLGAACMLGALFLRRAEG
ncbi:hypothetical protein DDZ14_04760 [Maritimibacter sp. 55A14]|uniref:hypothetical protein n=1 Tax=Maritimibacter sp. 55A14 TaxID=2174844 RepID=UPI000D60499C|nr:hypothetical protein [Maritimibacter sp. 55A14]PWE33506.1 hypothetical protein DDZ14_04760 [Maritimibacter sp. 55A14]